MNSRRLFFLIPVIIWGISTVFVITMIILGIFPISTLAFPIQVLFVIGTIFLCATSITHPSLIPLIPEGVFTGILIKDDKGKSSFKCGNCGDMDRFIYIEINKDLYVCSHCGEYNLFLDSEAINKKQGKK